ncbi:MAG: hypothetical protein UX04_C0001G0089 [Microgenomates group bacterium GW2011_GWF2_45_18]|nr:MAG: hypothetical protein UW18_C0003G0141 [Microgenomates group bacterium GW2011_GWF1_44_10]KKU02318.1 MAG: hypothetical protein UX04_C0001G0089 [Microgenomates group bacterium GW2011_GWF2_45_18]OGJ41653.1 MAG: hypothetical protein A2378_02090 [Candidatus Pacebacteria bacterium RIFOXYB1_FULL_44_10]HAU99216.1 hypothetical protein [Candidatus Paceibacterota bacterium]
MNVSRSNLPLIIFISCVVLFFGVLWSRLLFYSDGSLYTRNSNLWGDWAVHLTHTSFFEYQSLAPTVHPLFYNHPFSYTFGSSWISALIVRLGFSSIFTLTITSLFFSILLVNLVCIFFYQLSKSQPISILATILFLLNGGFGFLFFLRTFFLQPSFALFFNPPHKYTHMPEYLIQWANVIDSHIIPSRTFLFGFCIALIVVLIVHRILIQNRLGKHANLTLLFASVLYGILPIFHMHSFLAISFVFFFWFMLEFRNRKKDQAIRLFRWTLFGSISLILASVLYFQFLRDPSHQSYLRWFPGWYTNIYPFPIILFWIMNWTFTPFIATVEFFSHKRQHLHLIPFFVLFLLVNLFLFQPFIWDNTKFLVWISLGFSYLTATYFWTYFQKGLFWKVFVGIIFCITIFSGSLEVSRMLFSNADTRIMLDSTETSATNWIQKNTTSNAIILTSDHPYHPVPTRTGRRILMGYRGWLRTYGYDFAEIERDIEKMFETPNKSRPIFEKYNVSYIYVGNHELLEYQVDVATLKREFPIVYSDTEVTIYQRSE